MRARRQTGDERADQPRFADAGFAGEEHRPPSAEPRLCPALAESRELRLAIDQRRGVRADVERDGGTDRLLALDPQHLDGLVDPGQPVPAQRARHEHAVQQAVRGFADHDRIRPSECLQAGGNIGSPADRPQLVAAAVEADLAGDDEAGMDTDADLQWQGQRPRPAGTQRGDGGHDLQGRPYRAQRVVLVRGRVAEIGQNTVAHVVGDGAAIAGEGGGAARAVALQHLAHILGVEPVAQGGRAAQVAEQQGELAPLGGRPGPWLALGQSWRLLCPRHDERCTALAAKSRPGLVGRVARSADDRQPGAAVGTEPPLGRVIGAAGGAAHRSSRRLP